MPPSPSPLPPAIDIASVIECAKGVLTPSQWVHWACDCAERVLPLFEAAYPNNKRPREAIRLARAAVDAAADAARAAADAARAAADAADAAAYAAADAAYAAACAEMCQLIRTRWPQCPLPEEA